MEYKAQFAFKSKYNLKQFSPVYRDVKYLKSRDLAGRISRSNSVTQNNFRAGFRQKGVSK